jgi:hypothetical protein
MFLCADQVVLTNGDTITGSIIKKDGDKLTLKSEFLGEVAMPWSSRVCDRTWMSRSSPPPASPCKAR